MKTGVVVEEMCEMLCFLCLFCGDRTLRAYPIGERARFSNASKERYQGIKGSTRNASIRHPVGNVGTLISTQHTYKQDGDGHKLINLCAMSRILCVAEKPAIAKAVAQHLSGGSMQTVSLTGAEKKKKFLCEVEFAKNDVGVDTGKSICQELSI